jgi:hypothetical protein
LTSVLIKPKGINRIAYIYCCDIFLRQIDFSPFGFIKTEVNLPQEYVTAVDRGYPVDAFWFC